MNGQIYCESCGLVVREFAAPTVRALGRRVWSELLATHGSGEHRTCSLTFDLSPLAGAVASDVTRLLEIECTKAGCKNPKEYRVDHCPEWAIGIHQLAFHTSHEGHGMIVRWGGDEIARSPADVSR